MPRTIRFLAALVTSCCTLLAFASLSSAQQVLYGANGASGYPSNLYILDPSSGAALQTGGPIGFAVTGLALDPATGTLYGVTGNCCDPNTENHLITINKTTGQGTDVGDVGLQVGDITFTPDGALFGWNRSQGLVTINKTTGTGTTVGPPGFSSFGNGLASNAAGTIFLAGQGDNGPLRTVDRNTGATTVVATMNGGTGDSIGALAFDAAGTLFGERSEFGSPAFLITINTSSGDVGVRGRSVDRLDAIEFAPKPPRSVNLKKKKLKKKGKKKKLKVRLSGHVDSPGSLRTLVQPALQVPSNQSACEVGQRVELQRKKPKAASFGFFRQLTTDSAGNFSTKVKVKKTFQYRAVLSETALCHGATSNIQKVKKPKKKKRK